MSNEELDALLAKHSQKPKKPLDQMSDSELDDLLAKHSQSPKIQQEQPLSAADRFGINPAINMLSKGVESIGNLPANLINAGTTIQDKLLGTNTRKIPTFNIPRLGNANMGANQNAETLGSLLGWAVPGEAALSGISKAAPSLSQGIPATLARGGVSAGLGAANDPNDPIQGAGLGALLQGGGELAAQGLSKIAPYLTSPIRKLLASQVAKESGQINPQTGLSKNIGARTPEEVGNILNQLPSNFSTTLGELTQNPKVLSLEKGLEKAPFSGYKNALKQGIAQTDIQANKIAQSLLGESKPAEVSDNILSGLKNYKDTLKGQMESLYSPIEQSAEKAGFAIKERPNARSVFEQTFNKDSELNQKGVQLRPQFNKSELEEIQNVVNPKQAASFNEIRNLESDLKGRAREENAKNEYRRADFYNKLAEGLRKDYDKTLGDKLPGGLKDKLEEANRFSRENYYKLFNEDVNNLISGKNKDVFGTLKKNPELLDRLPQELKHQIFFNELGNKVEGSGEISPQKLLTTYNRGSPKAQELKERLLSPQLKRELDQLSLMNELTQRARRINTEPETTGKTLEPLAKAAFALSHPHIALGLLGGPLLRKSLMNPETLRAYAKILEKNPDAKKGLMQKLAQSSGSLSAIFNNQGNQ